MGGFGGLHLQGMANPANQPISGKIAKMALFNPCMKFEIFGGQMTSFEVFSNSTYITLFKKCLWNRPSAYPSGYRWMNGIISKTAHRIFFLFDILIFIYFFKYETIVRSSARSFGHSDPDPSSVV